MPDSISISEIIAQFGIPGQKTQFEVAADWLGSFQSWLASDYSSLVHQDRAPGLHASGIGKVCGRRNILSVLFGVRPRPHTAGNYLTFDSGHRAHHWWQERYLGPKQELIGNWVCVACRCRDCEKAEKAAGRRKLSVEERQAIWNKCGSCYGTGRKVTHGLMPLSCECGVPWQDAVHYMELLVRDETLDYVGHTDGILNHSPKKRLFEFKTISPSEYDKLNGKPKDEHVIQAHAYMGPLGLDEALIVYENKGSQCKWTVDVTGQFVAGDLNVIPFKVHYDQNLWKGVEQRIHDHHRSTGFIADLRLKEQEPTREDVSKFPRVCDNRKCELASRCPVSRECFNLD